MNNNIEIANLNNIDDIVTMAMELWPHHQYDELKREFVEIIRSVNEDVLLYKVDNEFVGFIQVAVRNDYVEGAKSSPTGFVEGIFVKSSVRKKGIAKKLVREGEIWSKERGCKQMGSDVEFHNTDSYQFHKSIGYQEVNRVICFLRDID